MGDVSSTSLPPLWASFLPLDHTRDWSIMSPNGNRLKEVQRGLRVRPENKRTFFYPQI